MLYVRNVSRTLSKSFFANIVNRFKPLSFFAKKNIHHNRALILSLCSHKVWGNIDLINIEIMRLIKHLKMLAMTGGVYNY